jgi:diguanylate cyclase (GGDEF)-like protein
MKEILLFFVFERGFNMMKYNELNERVQTISDEVNMRKISYEALEELLDNAKKVDNSFAQIYIIAAMGQYYYYQGETKKSFECMFDSYSLASALNNPEALIKAQSNLGAVYVSLGLYEHAFQYLMMALEGVEKYNLKEKIGILYINIGSCLFKQEMISESGTYFTLAYNTFKEQSNPYYKLYSILNMVAFSLKDGAYYDAQDYLDEANALREQLPLSMLCGIDSSFARIKAYMRDIDGSVNQMNQVIDTYFSKQVELILYDQIVDWTQVLIQFDSLHKAKHILKKVTEDLKGIETAVTAELMLMLANIYEEEGLYEESSKLFKESIKIKDDLYKKNQKFITENTLKLIEMTKKNKEITQKSLRDALTGCLNRHALELNGQYLLEKFNEENQSVAVIMFDIDYFKQYNDYYGHLKGDECIKLISKTITEVISDDSYFYRYGGDEFLIIKPLDSDGSEIAKTMLKSVRELNLAHQKSLAKNHVTISIGVSTKKGNNSSLQTAIDAADMNLYKAKFHNRNCACIDELIIN